MGDVIYYLNLILLMFGVPTLITLTIIFMAKPHIVNKGRTSPISRKRIFAIGLTALLIATIGCGSVMAATEPASVRTANAENALASQKAQALKTQQEQAAAQASIDAAKPVTKTITETQPVVFNSTTQNDNTLSVGQTSISTKGVNGVTTTTYTETFVNGKQTSKVQTGTTLTIAPVTQVTLVGTYVSPVTSTPAPAPAPTTSSSVASNCPNGTYVNSSGNTVCSPYASSSVPSGATAQCVDGSYSFSQHRSGTCSGHGGVASWL